jgi:hypothetical protein
MTKRLVAVYLIVVVLLAAFVPCCGPTTGTIDVKATLDGVAWTGAVNYTLTSTSGLQTSGTSVDNSVIVNAGTWTCAYVSGGPAGTSFANITPSATQSLTAAGTITFTLNFMTPVTPLNASTTFKSWTINGVEVPPGHYIVGPGTIIDAEYEVVVAGPAGATVTYTETDWFWLHYVHGEDEYKIVHIRNDDGAVKISPAAKKLSQMMTVGGNPVLPCTFVDLIKCVTVWFDLETTWNVTAGQTYKKTINWLGVPSPDDILLDLQPVPVPAGNYTMVTQSCVTLAGDVDPTDDCTGNSTMLSIEYIPIG